MLEIVVKILEKCPNSAYKNRDKIFTQQDGDPSHLDENKDDEWHAGLVELGVSGKIKLFDQPGPVSRPEHL